MSYREKSEQDDHRHFMESTDARLFKTTSCFERHKRPRCEQRLSKQEERRMEISSGYQGEEAFLQACVQDLLFQGLKPGKKVIGQDKNGKDIERDETLGEFVLSNQDCLSNDTIESVALDSVIRRDEENYWGDIL